MSEKIEREMRFVLTDGEYEAFKERARYWKDFIRTGRAVHELTVMYDNPNPEYSFYSKDVDGRLRVRTVKPGTADIFPAVTEPGGALLTWKQRIPELTGDQIHREKEIEAQISAEEIDAVILLLEQVLKCPRVSSYERNRETFYMGGVEVASDLFPYGHVVELELKQGEERELKEMAEALGLKEERTSRLSCDDMYRKLCEYEGICEKNDILFCDEQMPKLNTYLEGEEVCRR